MEEQTSDSTYRISGLYVTPNWNGNSDRVAMSCGIGAYIKVCRKVSINGDVVVIASDPAGTIARSWNMTARNTILRTTAKVYLYARVERDGSNGMYIWSPNVYNIDGITSDKSVTAVNNDQYYYIRVGSLEENRTECIIDEGQYGVDWGDSNKDDVGYTWSDLIAWDRTHDFLVFLKTIAGLAIEYIILAGHEINRVLTSDDKDSVDESSDNAVVTAGFLQKWVNKIKEMFLRKDDDDETSHKLTMGEAISDSHRTRSFREGGIDGAGAAIWETTEEGMPIGHVESDFMTIRRAAYFRSITIAEVNHIGGEMILSQAACQISHFEEHDDVYRCFFEKEAGGRTVYNEWKVGDQARCQRWTASANNADGTYYWRLVTAVHPAEEGEDYHWIELSKTIADAGSMPPAKNDNIVLLGYRGSDNRDRTCAQVYSTIGDNAPSRRYYEGITSFSLPSPIECMEYEKGNAHWRVGNERHFVEYSNDVLDIRTSSITIAADGQKDVNVADALSDNFTFITSTDEAPATNGKVDSWIRAERINPSNRWSDDECSAHVGDYLITTDCFTYVFAYNATDGYGWSISSDPYLIHAQESANSALQNLEDMASDYVVTPQEKVSMRTERQNVESNYNYLRNEATAANVDLSKSTQLTLWYRVYVALLDFILSTPDDNTLLYNSATGMWLTATINSGSSLVSINDDRVADEQPTTPVGKNVKFSDCYRVFYYYLANLRYEITYKFNSRINNLQVNGSDINTEILSKIGALEKSVGDVQGSNEELTGQYAAITNNVILKDPASGTTWNALKGLLTADGYASMFATAFNENQEVIASALSSVYVTYDPKTGNITSGISLAADQIDFSASSMSVFAGDLIIDTNGFKLGEDGDAEFMGKVSIGSEDGVGITIGNSAFADNGTTGTSAISFSNGGSCRLSISCIDGHPMLRFGSKLFHPASRDNRESVRLSDEGLIIYADKGRIEIKQDGISVDGIPVIVKNLPVATYSNGVGANLVDGQLFRVADDNVIRIKL